VGSARVTASAYTFGKFSTQASGEEETLPLRLRMVTSHRSIGSSS